MPSRSTFDNAEHLGSPRPGLTPESLSLLNPSRGFLARNFPTDTTPSSKGRRRLRNGRQSAKIREVSAAGSITLEPFCPFCAHSCSWAGIEQTLRNPSESTSTPRLKFDIRLSSQFVRRFVIYRLVDRWNVVVRKRIRLYSICTENTKYPTIIIRYQV